MIKVPSRLSLNVKWPVVAAALALGVLIAPVWTTKAEEDAYSNLRAKMVQTISAHARRNRGGALPNHISPDVLDAMGRVPRHLFVPKQSKNVAYEDRPLPIGFGQTISQPYIVALMTELLDVEAGDTVLEIGTGSGYQAAVLAALGVNVYTIEIIEPLATRASDRLGRLTYSASVRHSDGYYGWPEVGPFDGIIVTAAAVHIPPPLIEQLKPGAKIVIPVGPRFYTQQLVLVTKDKNGRVRTRQLLPVSFVPFTGKQ